MRTILIVACTLVFIGLVVVVLAGGRLGNVFQKGASEPAAAIAASLSTAANFAVLAGTTITNTGNSVITGDMGLSPGTLVSGFPPGLVSGTQHITDGEAAQAELDLTAAYLTTASEGPTQPISTIGGGQTLSPGVYNSASSIQVNGALTLDGGGDPNAVFVFQAGSALTTGSASSVILTNGAQACNVFWQVTSSATLGTGSTFAGNILALTSITLTTGATLNGSALARNGTVSLDDNVITKAPCSSPTLGTVHVIKSVVNTGGGSAVASDFTMNVKTTSGTNVSGSPAAGLSTPGRTYSLAAGSYVVSEATPVVQYVQSFGSDCPLGAVTLTAGADQTCTVINTYTPVASSGRSGSYPAEKIQPLIGIVKVPSPLALPSGAGPVTYAYIVTNVGGIQALTSVTVTDDKCSPVQFLSGDINGNSKLDPNEKWNYTCATTLATTTTNTATATGYSDDVYRQVAVATAVATVAVGVPEPPPLISLVKVPSRLTSFPFGGGPVTYTYTVTNPGVVAMHDVTVTDDKCAPVSRVSGDANADNLLAPSETWTYTCGMNVTASLRNVATAKGMANGFTAIGYAFATVVVDAPKLPNAGFPPR